MSLADRIVVMYQGKIEQIGTPMEVYQDSATKFVAEFIGTSPTNFFDVVIEKEGEKLYAVNKEFRYAVPEELKEALMKYEGTKVDMGVRPEYCSVSPECVHSEGYMCDVTVEFTEPQGSHSILITHVDGKEVKIHTTKYMNMTPGTKISLGVEKNRVMFFDCETTKRIK